MFTIIREIIRVGKFALSSFSRDERGVTTIEYGLLAAGLALIIGLLVDEGGPFYNALSDIFAHVTNTMTDGASSEGGGTE